MSDIETPTEDGDILDELFGAIGIENKDELPHEKLYREFTEGRYPKMINVQYWFKHEWYVMSHYRAKGWFLSKPNGANRVQVGNVELSRAMLEYFFHMTQLPRFKGEDAIRRGQAVDMEKFLDLVMEEPTIKKIIENPNILI